MAKRNEWRAEELLLLAAGWLAVAALQGFAEAQAQRRVSTTERLAKIIPAGSEVPEQHSPGAKARVDSGPVVPGMNSRPTARAVFSASVEAVTSSEAVAGGAFWQPVQATAQSTSWPATPPPAGAAYVPTLTFDVASVRQSADQNSYMVGDFHEGTFRALNFGIQNLLMMAYGLDGYHEVAGVPESFRWKFNVQAKADDSAEKLAKLNPVQVRVEQQHMLQVLLADRFQLKAHFETKQGEIYKLVVVNRSKLRETRGNPTGAKEADAPDQDSPLYQRGDSRSGWEFVGHGCPMGMLVDMLTRFFARPVIDETGLGGRYDFVLRYNGIGATEEYTYDNAAAPLETAIQDQLGLKLEPAKGPVRRLVVDHVEKPTEN